MASTSGMCISHPRFLVYERELMGHYDAKLSQLYVGETKREFVPIFKRDEDPNRDAKEKPTPVVHSG